MFDEWILSHVNTFQLTISSHLFSTLSLTAHREQTRIQNRPLHIFLCWKMAVWWLPSNEIRSIIKPSWIFWFFGHSSKIFPSYSPDYIFKIHTQHIISLKRKDQELRHTIARTDTHSTSKLTIFIYTLSRFILTRNLLHNIFSLYSIVHFYDIVSS